VLFIRVQQAQRPTASTFGGALTGGSIATGDFDPPLMGGLILGRCQPP
jgi:hypothetical protein